jgi:hypothetical protein
LAALYLLGRTVTQDINKMKRISQKKKKRGKGKIK